MEKRYQGPSQIASFESVDTLHRATQGKVSKKRIHTWLEWVGRRVHDSQTCTQKISDESRNCVFTVDQ